MSGGIAAAADDGWGRRYEEADWVSRVRIESVGSLVNPSMSRAQLAVIQGYRYSASVLRDWKGGHSGNIKFEVDLSDCHERLEVDREYIVFGLVNPSGGLQSGDCDDLVSIEDAENLPAQLDELSEAAMQTAGSGGESM